MADILNREGIERSIPHSYPQPVEVQVTTEPSRRIQYLKELGEFLVSCACSPIKLGAIVIKTLPTIPSTVSSISQQVQKRLESKIDRQRESQLLEQQWRETYDQSLLQIKQLANSNIFSDKIDN